MAAAMAVVVVVLIPVLRPHPETEIQIAVLDTAGATRGSDTNELLLLQQAWKGAPLQNFSNANELEVWVKNWPKAGRRPVVKVVYDPAAAEVRVTGHSRGSAFERIFQVEKDLAATLKQVGTFITEQTTRR